MLVLPRLRISALLTTALGGVLLIGSILCYQVALGGSSVIGTREISIVEAIAVATLCLIFLGLVLVFVGLTRHLLKMSSGTSSNGELSLLTQLSWIISGRRSARIFAVATIIYGLFFGFVSSTLVFQPGLFFSSAYGVKVPSAALVLCCGSIGQTPQVVVYITQQFAILIIPLNLLLLFVVSWLVGLNATVASYVYANKSRLGGSRWIGGLGALLGLFTVCPSCAGLFFLATVGLSGAVALALALSSLQALFIMISIPALLVPPILVSRRYSTAQACALEKKVSQR